MCPAAQHAVAVVCGKRKAAAFASSFLENRMLLADMNVLFQYIAGSKVLDPAHDSLYAGQDFVLRAEVQDARGTSAVGVSQAYFNLSFAPSGIASFTSGTVTLGNDFMEGAISPTFPPLNPESVQDIGGTDKDSSPPGNPNLLYTLFTVQCHANAAGTLTVTPEAATTGIRQLFGSADPLSWDDIDFSGTSIPVADNGVTPNADTQSPTVTSVTPNLTMLSDATAAAAQPAFSVTVVYDEAMNETVAPTLTFTPDVASTLALNASSAWSNSTTYVAWYDVADANLAVPNVGIGVTLARDLAGNVQTPYSGTNNFNVDTQNPTVTLYSLEPDTGISGDQITSNTTPTLTYVFSEPISGSASDVAVSGATHGAVTPDTFGWGSYALTLGFSLPLLDDVYTVTLNGSTPGYIADAAGNALHGNQSGGNNVRTFTIDTAAPVVSSVTPSVTMVADANMGTATFSVTVVYNEPMDQRMAPTLTFTPDVAGTLSLNAASGWTNNTTYVAWYDVADGNVAVPNVGIGVTLAQDVAGNVQTPYSGTNNFNVDTQNPTVTSYSLSPDTGIDGNQITWVNAPALTYTFSEPIFNFGGDVAVSGATHGAVTPRAAWNTQTLTLWFTFGLLDDVYTVTLNGSTPGYIADAAGNALHGNQSGGNNVRTFTIDTAAPVVSSVTPNLTMVADADMGTATFSVTVVYNEPMDQRMAPTLTFTPDVAGTLSLNAASGWTNNTTYVAWYDVADGNVAVPNVGIGVTLAQDVAGNVQTPYSGTNNFNVDTQNPTVILYSLEPDTGISGNQITAVRTPERLLRVQRADLRLRQRRGRQRRPTVR